MTATRTDAIRVPNVPAVPIPEELQQRLLKIGQAQQFIDDNRDRLILEAAEAGGSLREIAELVGITHSGVRKIIQKAKQ